MFDFGVRLQLLLGPTLPAPASYDVVDALRSIEVRNDAEGQDGFQMEFTLGKEPLRDYGLLQSGALDPPNRVVIVAIFNFMPEVLIDGIITDHQIVAGDRPGEAVLRVSGLDLSALLDLEEKNESFPNRPDWMIVRQLLTPYMRYGLFPQITPTTDVPIDVQRVPTQQCSDRDYIQMLARRNNYSFYIEYTPAPGVSRAYWGPEVRVGMPQAPLTVNMLGQTNVDAPLHFRFNALGPESPVVTIIEPLTGIPVTLPIPSPGGGLASRPAPALRTTVSRDAAKLNPAQAIARALASVGEGADAVEVTGEVDAARYGRALRARRLVSVRGVGGSYSGFYYVSQVTHTLRRGEYKQRFKLVRGGRGAQSPVVNPT